MASKQSKRRTSLNQHHFIPVQGIIDDVAVYAMNTAGHYMQFVDFTHYLNEMLQYVVGYQPYRTLRLSQCYRAIATYGIPQEIAEDIVYQYVRRLETRIVDTVKEKVHYDYMYVQMIPSTTSILLLQIELLGATYEPVEEE